MTKRQCPFQEDTPIRPSHSLLFTLPHDILTVLFAEVMEPPSSVCAHTCKTFFKLFLLRSVHSKFLYYIDRVAVVPVQFVVYMLKRLKTLPISLKYWTGRLAHDDTPEQRSAVLTVFSCYFEQAHSNSIVDTLASAQRLDAASWKQLFEKAVSPHNRMHRGILSQEALCLEILKQNNYPVALRQAIVCKAAHFGQVTLLGGLIKTLCLDDAYLGLVNKRFTVRHIALYYACKSGNAAARLITAEFTQFPQVARSKNWLGACCRHPSLFLLMIPHLPQHLRGSVFFIRALDAILRTLNPFDLEDRKTIYKENTQFSALWSLLTLREAQRCFRNFMCDTVAMYSAAQGEFVALCLLANIPRLKAVFGEYMQDVANGIDISPHLDGWTAPGLQSPAFFASLRLSIKGFIDEGACTMNQ